MIGSMIRSDRAKKQRSFSKQKRKKSKETRRDARARDVRRFTKIEATTTTSSRNRYRKVSLRDSNIYMILYVSSPRERTDREKNCWRKRKERESVCAPILLRRNRRRRDLTVSRLKCVVCVLRVWIFWRKSNLSYYFKRKAQKEREIFSSCVHF